MIERTIAEWVPTPRCCWCQSPFIKDVILGSPVWVCPTEVCRDRQLRWKMTTVKDGLFYLPNPRQVVLEEAVASRLYTAICIGGARGGSKSKGWRMIAERYCRTLPNFTVLFLRREYKPLIRNHLRFIHQEAKAIGAKYASMMLTCPDTDSTIEFGHCQDPDDWKNYQGSEADLIIFEQLEQFTELQFHEISASTARVDRDDWRGLVGASENPGGPLSAFVDTVFVNKNPDPDLFPDYLAPDYHFIYSHMEDNPYISASYVKNLAGMSVEKRETYRFGRRDVFPGQFFPDFDPLLHVRS